MTRQVSRWLPVLIATFASAAIASEPKASGDPMELFESRIMPIFRSDKPSSCVQCHLSSVDLKNYILPSHTDTFVALREEGLINLDNPSESKILQLIQMGEEDRDLGAQRIHAKTRQAEYEAFSAWIHACCADPKLRTLAPSSELSSVGPEKPLEIVRHSRKSRIADSFTRNIWSQRMRCFPCHTPHEIDPNNPKHEMAGKKQKEFVEKYGAKMNLFDETPEATMTRWIASSRRTRKNAYPLVNLEDPAHSLILLKPTAKLPPKKDDGTFEKPSSVDPVSHMGGLKMHTHDQSYKSFVAWIDDYAAIVDGRYADVEDLPADDWVPTQRVIRIREVPTEWAEQAVIQLFVHAKNDDGSWSDHPIAFTQNSITPRRMMNGALFAFQSQGGEEALVPGSYLIKAFVDRSGKLDQDPAAMLGKDAYVGQAVIDAQWEIGFPKAQTFSATEFK